MIGFGFTSDWMKKVARVFKHVADAKARENVRELVMIGLDLLLIGWKKWREFLSQSSNVLMQNQVLFDTWMKTLFLPIRLLG